MKRKILKLLVDFLAVVGTITVIYGITSFFYSIANTTEMTGKVDFRFDFDIGVVNQEIGPGDSFTVNTIICNTATEEMYVFIKIDMPTLSDGEPLYTYDVDSEWSLIESDAGMAVYAYGIGEMQTLQPGENTTALTEQLTMKSISNAEFAGIDDINVTFTGYAMGTEDASTNPGDAWNECKTIGNID